MTISSAGSLTIEDGVVVKFRSSSRMLLVSGNLTATGAVFTSYKDDEHGGDINNDDPEVAPAPGDWARIEFRSGSSGSLTNC